MTGKPIGSDDGGKRLKRRGQRGASPRPDRTNPPDPLPLKRSQQRAAIVVEAYLAGQRSEEIAARMGVPASRIEIIVSQIPEKTRATRGVGVHPTAAGAGDAMALRREVRERLKAVRAVQGGGRLHQGLTPEECVAALRAFAKESGRPPRAIDFGRPSRVGAPNQQRVRQIFGSWNAALAAAGLPIGRRGGGVLRWSDEAILEAIREADRAGKRTAAAFKVGRYPNLGTIVTRFGSWSRARQLALSRPRASPDDTAAGRGNSP